MIQRCFLALLVSALLIVPWHSENLDSPGLAASAQPKAPAPAPVPVPAQPAPDLDPRRAVARHFPIAAPEQTVRELSSQPNLLVARSHTGAILDTPSASRRSWSEFVSVRIETTPLSPAAPVPVGSEHSSGDASVAVPLSDAFRLRAGFRVAVEDRVDSWEVSGAPTVGFELRF